MLVSHRTTSSSAAVARGTSSRVRPFSSAVNRSSKAQQKQQRLVAKAAEEEQPEAETEEVPEQQAIAAEEFEFSFSEAKKGNQWQPSDVTAALEYYEAEKFLGGSSDMPYEAEFVTNPLSVYEGGPEDSSWLADVDNNEAYERDEYSLAGIPEAAPKVKRREEEEEDNSEELRALEDEKIGASAFDDVEGLDDEEDANAVWNWALDEAAAAEDDSAAQAASGRSAESDILSGISESEVFADDTLTLQQKEVISYMLDPLADDDGAVDLIGQELPEATDDGQALTQEEKAAIAAVLEDDSADADAESALAEARQLVETYGAKLSEAVDVAAIMGEEAPIDAAAVNEYLSVLKAMGASEPEGLDDATLAQLLEGEEPEEAGPSIELEAVPTLPAGIAELLAQQDADIEVLSAEADPSEAEADAALTLLDSIEALSAELDSYNEGAMQAAEDVQNLEIFASTMADLEDLYAAGEDGLEEPAMEAPIDPYADMDPELLGADAFGVDEEDNYADRYGTQFQERILELGRVTKVVKGGKLMGFRCVAVVGDGKGRVGVGCQAGREVGTAVKRALVDAKKNIVEVPLVGAGTIPHRSEAWFKAAGVVLQPAADGTGVIAGGAVRAVLELAGVQNVLGKRLGSRSTLNNARVTLKALGQLRTLSDYAEARGVPLDYMLS